MIRKLFISLILILPNGVPPAFAGEGTGSGIKANDLYNLTQYVEWPPSALAPGASPLVIGVLGKDPFGKYLDEAVRGKTADGHRLEVKRLGVFSVGRPLPSCQVLFIASSEKGRLEDILRALKDTSTLTVSDMGQFCERGGGIQLDPKGSPTALTLNLAAVKNAKLSVRSPLLSVAQFYPPLE